MISFTLNPSPPQTTFLHTPFLSTPISLTPTHKPIKPHRATISSIIIPSSSNPQQPKQQQQQSQQQKLYQPFRAPLTQSPIPQKYRSLDTTARLDVLTNRLGVWYEYAPLIPPLIQDGFDPSILEEITGISGHEQNTLVVGAQVRESLVQSGVDDYILEFFDKGGAELLYEIRLLTNHQRADAAKYMLENRFEPSDAQELARAIKESSMAKYIVQQYIAAAGGEKALNKIDSMYAVGKVKMVASEFNTGDEITLNCGVGKALKPKSVKNGGGEMGGFVLWQKRPDLWSLELVVSGYKISAGSDGKVAWRQTPWHNSHASRGPPRPLRRSLQGLDPKSTANLFTNSICIGEKTIKGEDCFVLKLEADLSALKIRSSNNVQIMKHTIWGYFSQRTGLLHQLKDSQLIRIKTPGSDNVFWETTMESLIQDYRTIEGVNIAHGGQTTVSLYRFGEDSEGDSETKMEEVWTIEEVDFNIKGLSMDCFLPPSDLKMEDQPMVRTKSGDKFIASAKLPFKSWGNGARFGVSKVVAIDSNGFGDM